MSVSDFSFLCPALLHQIDGEACILHVRTTERAERGRRISVEGVYSLFMSVPVRQQPVVETIRRLCRNTQFVQLDP